MIVDLELYRNSKNKNQTSQLQHFDENNNQNSSQCVKFLDCGQKHPALLEAIQRASTRSW